MQPSSQLSLDDGFQFGLGAFETIAIEHGQPSLFFLKSI